MQSPAPQPTSRQTSQASPVRRARIRIKPILGGIAFIVIGAKNLGPTLEQGRRWETLQREGQRTTAQVLTSQVAIASSGKIASYEVSYEFTAAIPGNDQSQEAASPLTPSPPAQGEAAAVEPAPAEPTINAEPPVAESTLADATPPKPTAAASGSTTSAAEVQAMLQEQFWNPTPDGSFRSQEASPSEGQDSSQTSEPPDLPPGQRYIRGRQILSKADYQKLGFGLGSKPLTVIYDAQEPSNSAIAGTGSYPTGKLAFLSLSILGGTGLLALGLSPLWDQPARNSK